MHKNEQTKQIKMYSVGYFIQGTSADHLRVLLVEDKHHFKGLGTTFVPEKNDHTFIGFQKEAYLENLEALLQQENFFNQAFINKVMKEERDADRTFPERTLIVGFLTKAGCYPTYFQMIDQFPDDEVSKQVFLVEALLVPEGDGFSEILPEYTFCLPEERPGYDPDIKKLAFCNLQNALELLERDKENDPNYRAFLNCVHTYISELPEGDLSAATVRIQKLLNFLDQQKRGT